MKNANLIGTILLTVTLAAGMTGCKTKKPMVTPIPDNGRPSTTDTTAPPPAPTPAPQPAPSPADTTPTPAPISTEPVPLDNKAYTPLFAGDHNEDREKFKADTIYFDFDSSTIKPTEEANLQSVANYFKDNKKFEALIIEGNCDERGTEKYNLSIGERRALAAREYLSNLGVDPVRIKTVTYGASRPAETGHDESAWKKNRRDEFILVTPK
jgi:peptidoglycan-associated lipoprotein